MGSFKLLIENLGLQNHLSSIFKLISSIIPKTMTMSRGSTMSAAGERGGVPANSQGDENLPEIGVPGLEMDKETQKRLYELYAEQNNVDLLNHKERQELLKIDQKYSKLMRPYLDKRNDIIKRVPKFWLTTFINHPHMSTVIEEEEEDCLQYLNKLDVVEYEDITTGFSINLHFDDNPYFENEVITKEFPMTVNRQPGKKSTTTPILWKEGFDLAAKAAQLIAARAAKGDKDKKESPETRTFFSWFCASGDPVEDDIAELVKVDMWPNPLQYFLVPDVEMEGGEGDQESEPMEQGSK